MVPECCCPLSCCWNDLIPPIGDLTVTIESADCAAIDGATFTLPIDNSAIRPSTTNCWRGFPDTHACIATTDGYYQFFKICCCLPEQVWGCAPDAFSCDGFCLTISPTENVGNCFFDPVTDLPPDSCTCDPFELVFTTTVSKILLPVPIPEVCNCCAFGDVITIRVTL